MSRSAERPLFSQCGPPFRAPIIFSRASTFPWAAGRWRHCRRAAPWSIRLGGGLLSGLDASPEPLFGGEKEVLIKGVRGNKDLDPFASACDDGEGGGLGVGDPHVVYFCEKTGEGMGRWDGRTVLRLQ